MPGNTLSDAVPYTIAKSFDDGDTVAYTITGPKVEKTRAIAFGLLGFLWVMGGIMLLFTPNPSLTAPVWIVYSVLLGAGGLMCFQSIYRFRISRTKFQIEIKKQSGRAFVSMSGSHEKREFNEATIGCYPNADEKDRWIVTVCAQGQVVFVLGGLKSQESALFLAELVSDESGLPIESPELDEHVNMLTINRLVGSDDRALRKPIATKHMQIHFE